MVMFIDFPMKIVIFLAHLWTILEIIELDDGKILTGNPDQFDGKNPWVSGSDFPNKTNPLIMGFP